MNRGHYNTNKLISEQGLYNVISLAGYENSLKILGEDFNPTTEMMIDVISGVIRDRGVPIRISEVLSIVDYKNLPKDMGVVMYENYVFYRDRRVKYNNPIMERHIPILYRGVINYIKGGV